LGGKKEKKNPATHNPLHLLQNNYPPSKYILPYPKIRQMKCKNNVPKS
jgi:hypothetical protein